MKLTLTTDDGELLYHWYLPDDQLRYCAGRNDKRPPDRVIGSLIEDTLPVWDSEEEYRKEVGK